MQYAAIDSPAEADVRFQGYRLEVISQWPSSARKVALAEAISQRLTSIGRGALVRPDIADLLNLSCRLLDDFFAAGPADPGLAGDRPEGHAVPVPSRSIIS
jgi:hypothetical protein